jgi:hypothetical protein
VPVVLAGDQREHVAVEGTGRASLRGHDPHERAPSRSTPPHRRRGSGDRARPDRGWRQRAPARRRACQCARRLDGVARPKRPDRGAPAFSVQWGIRRPPTALLIDRDGLRPCRRSSWATRVGFGSSPSCWRRTCRRRRRRTMTAGYARVRRRSTAVPAQRAPRALRGTGAGARRGRAADVPATVPDRRTRAPARRRRRQLRPGQRQAQRAAAPDVPRCSARAWKRVWKQRAAWKHPPGRIRHSAIRLYRARGDAHDGALPAFTRERSQVRNPPRPSPGSPAFAGLLSL